MLAAPVHRSGRKMIGAPGSGLAEMSGVWNLRIRSGYETNQNAQQAI